jgi:sporulation and spore germination protein
VSRAFRITLLLLLLAVLAGLLELPALRMQVLRLERLEQSEEEARRQVIRPVAEGQEGKKEKVAIYWLSADDPSQLAAVETLLSLGADPVERARVALESLITGAPTPEQRVLPEETAVLAFYLLPDGTAIADFSDALSHQLPSGIATEQLALDAITRTLHAAVPQVRRLRILIDGQEAETLAGHVDVSGAFDLTLMTPNAPAAGAAPPAAQPGKAAAPGEKVAPVAPKPRPGE